MCCCLQWGGVGRWSVRFESCRGGLCSVGLSGGVAVLSCGVVSGSGSGGSSWGGVGQFVL